MIPSIFRNPPDALRVVDAPANSLELAAARAARAPFLVPDQPEPYMHDVVRAFRLVRGARTYIEIGTRDRGNIAYTAQLLGPDPTIVDVDLDRLPHNENLIAAALRGRARYQFIHGNSVAPDVVATVAELVGQGGADAIFCDSSHMYDHALAEFELYFPLLRPGGVLMFHDACWEGNTNDKGKAQAMAAINCFVPVWLVVMDEPLHRFLPRSSKGDTWGTVAIIRKPAEASC